MSPSSLKPQHDWHCKLRTRLSSRFTAEICVVKDGTLPFDPQKIAEDILEGVQHSYVYDPSQPGEFRKTFFSAPQTFAFDARTVLEAPRKKKRSDMRGRSVEETIKWLNSPSQVHPDKTKIELYLEKRTAHKNALKHKDHSYKQASETTKRDPRNESVEDQQAAYNRWVAENCKRLNGAVQAAHMDWVTTASKTDVEFHLSIVDLDLDKAVRKVLEGQVFPSSRPLLEILIGVYRRRTRWNLEGSPYNLCVCISSCDLGFV